jgi:hypothetical protein
MSDHIAKAELARDYLQDAIQRFRRLKTMVDKSLAQVDDDAFFAALTPEGNSIAILLKHIAGNMRSRWRDLLTTDGEKPDRHRDTEFEVEQEDTRDAIVARWEAGWRYLFEALELLGPEDLHRTIYIRERPHSIVQAINRQLSHYAYHVGQIVFLAKHFQSGDWQWLSIPPGQSEQFNAAMRRTARS